MRNPAKSAQIPSDERPPLSPTRKLLDVLSYAVTSKANKEDLKAILEGESDAPCNALTKIITRGRSAHTPARIAHKVPHIPFVLNGTLYDPQDVQRFNGKALHWILPMNNAYMLTLDDIGDILAWWRLLRLASLEHYKGGVYYYGHQTHGPVPAGDQTPIQGYGQVTPQDHRSGGGEGPVSAHFYFSFLYEDMNYSGDYLTLESNKGWEGYSYEPQQYPNLEGVSRGFLGSGDWEDVISSVKVEHGTCVLYENHYFGVLDGGSSLTLTQSESFLERLGWNDRVSSAEAF